MDNESCKLFVECYQESEIHFITLVITYGFWGRPVCFCGDGVDEVEVPRIKR